MTRAAGVRAHVVAGATVAGVSLVLGLAGCGVPGSGEVRTIADEDVPYGLLEPETPAPATGEDLRAQAKVPAVFWLEDERLVPSATGDVCGEDPDVLVGRLLDALAAGPSEEARTRGRSSALPADFGLELTGVDDGTVTIDIEPGGSLGAEQLPAAVGQVVLTVTSAPTVRWVVLTSDGEPLQVPLPQGPLTDGPVAARDYVELLPRRLHRPGRVGCPPA